MSLKSVLNRHNMTLPRLAELTGIMKGTLASYIFRQDHPTAKNCIVIRDAINKNTLQIAGNPVTVDELLED